MRQHKPDHTETITDDSIYTRWSICIIQQSQQENTSQNL
jgi:hypothetical protein